VIQGAISRHTVKALKGCELYLLVEKDVELLTFMHPLFSQTYKEYKETLVEGMMPGREEEEMEAQTHRAEAERLLASKREKGGLQRESQEQQQQQYAAAKVQTEHEWDRASALGITEQVRWIGEAMLQQQQMQVQQQAELDTLKAHLVKESAKTLSMERMLQQLLEHNNLPFVTAYQHSHSQRQLNLTTSPELGDLDGKLMEGDLDGKLMDKGNSLPPLKRGGSGAVGATNTAQDPGASAFSSDQKRFSDTDTVTPVSAMTPQQQRYEIKKAEIRQQILEKKRNDIRSQAQHEMHHQQG